MTSTCYCSVLETVLLPFVNTVFQDGHRFQQGNDPKLTSNYTKKFLHDNGITWWKTSAESHDLYPVENVWGLLKYYLRHQYKPNNLEGIITGVKVFWTTLFPEVCSKYIGHVHTVMPKVVQLQGAASGY